MKINKLKEHFRGKSKFNVSDIVAFYRQSEENVKRSTVDWRIHELKNLAVLQRIGQGWYSLEEGKLYQPEVDNSLKVLYNKAHINFPYLKLCLWNTKWFNEFMIHQPGRFYQLVETEKDAVESVFFFLKGLKKNMFLSPTNETLIQYAFDQKEITIVTNLVTEAPVQTGNGVPTATLEKMLVDVFCDEELFGAQQGQELKNIFRNAFEKYLVNEPKLLRYATRRKRREDIQEFIKALQRNGTKI